MIRAGIIGEMGPIVAHLIDLLFNHPDVELSWVADATGRHANQRIDELWPQFVGDSALTIVTPPEQVDDIDVVFLASRGALALLPQELPQALRVIDMQPATPCPPGYTYGLCEVNRKHMVRKCTRVAMPSAAATSVLLALLPLARNLLLAGDIKAHITLMMNGNETHEAEYTDNCQPEFLAATLQAIQASFDGNVSVEEFQEDNPVLHVLKTTVTLDCAIDLDVLSRLYVDYYDDHNLTHITSALPASSVSGTNKCYIHLAQDGAHLTVTSLLDLQHKGSAGNAVHVMNLLFGLHERVGLAPQP